jgi:hypothetical protein
MRSDLVFTLAASLFAAANAPAQREIVRPVATPAAGQDSVAEIHRIYGQLENNIELKYATLIKDAVSNENAVVAWIKSLEKVMENLSQGKNPKGTKQDLQKLD